MKIIETSNEKLILDDNDRIVTKYLKSSDVTASYSYNSDGKILHIHRNDNYESWWSYYEGGSQCTTKSGCTRYFTKYFDTDMHLVSSSFSFDPPQ